jgi:hypothetical protein
MMSATGVASGDFPARTRRRTQSRSERTPTCLVLHDDEQTDVLVGHEMHGGESTVPWSDGPQGLGLGGKDLPQWPKGKNFIGTSEELSHDA